MKEPTRQQVKEALKETIERWERIVDDVSYFKETKCALCLLEADDDMLYVCSQVCPIRLYTGDGSCCGSPYNTFFRDETPEHALAELNFLRKVYIWWMEKEANKILDKVAMYGKEEKKEEWVDVTEECNFKIHKKYTKPKGEQTYYLEVWCGEKSLTCTDLDCHLDKDGNFSILFFKIGNEEYKFDVTFDDNFRILKKT